MDAIKGQRAALAPVIRLYGLYDPSGDASFGSLLRNFGIERPRERRDMPKWDLGIVLAGFLRPPFVSGDPTDPDVVNDHFIDLAFLTLKTVFLVALATGRRRSYVHALP